MRTQECDSSEQDLKIYFIACLHRQSYHSTAVIKMVEPLSKDYTHYFITEDNLSELNPQPSHIAFSHSVKLNAFLEVTM